MQLTLIRSVFTEKSTFGKLSMDGKIFAFTCEDKVRNIGENCKGKINCILPVRLVLLSFSLVRGRLLLQKFNVCT